LKTALLCVGTSLSSNGFRRIASLARTIDPDTRVCFVLPSNSRSIFGLLGITSYTPALNQADIDRIADSFRDTDILGISCMSMEAAQCERIAASVKRINPGIFLIWGGVHAITNPTDLLPHADALCVSEGDIAFPILLRRLINGEPYLDTKNFWFRTPEGRIIKNALRPLTTPEELDELPPPLYADGEEIYRPGKGFTSLTARDHFPVDALSYSTIWTRGCVFKCTYCGNSHLFKVDPEYGRIRQPSVETLLREIRAVLKVHPHIQTVCFFDDCFMALPESVLTEFAREWRRQIGRPFAVLGVTPVHITRPKMEILISAGLNRVRMGIQSGSDRILRFFERPNRTALAMEKATLLKSFGRKLIPPSYDIIVDIPAETKEDVDLTLSMIYHLPRPFHLNVFSLRLIPNSELERQLSLQGLTAPHVTDSTYISVSPTFANALLFFIAVFPMPRRLFEYCLRFTAPAHESRRMFNLLMIPLKFFFYSHRLLSHIRAGDFSLYFAPIGWLLWRLGFLKRQEPR